MLRGEVVKTAVPTPMMIMLTAKVASRVDRYGALITRWTATPYTRKPNSKPKHGHDEQGQVGVQPQAGEEEIDAKHAQGHDRAVSQVDDVHHAPDQGQAHGRHAVDKAHQQPIDQGGEQLTA